MVVFDGVLADPVAYRQAALARPFGAVSINPEVWFHGIQLTEDPTFPAWIQERFPQLTPTLSFFRKSPFQQVEPNYVHTDRDMGDWTAILYLNPQPVEGDGTTFWRHRATGAFSSVTHDTVALLDEQRAWRDLAQWEPVAHVAAKFGRALVFPAERFHSRAIPENYGLDDEARLIQVVFGVGTLGKD
jgi:Family of unknown function (DUF6445)